MDGENNGSKPYEQMDDLGVFPIFLETPIYNLNKGAIFDNSSTNPKTGSAPATPRSTLGLTA